MNDEFVIHQEDLDKEPHQGSGNMQPEEPPKKRRRFTNGAHWKRALKWLAIVVIVAAVAVAAFLYYNVAKISVHPFGFGKLHGEDRGRINIMMLGVGDPGHDGENLSDTNILLSINTVDHKIAVISVPRDTRVEIPGNGENKINNANADGGIETAKTVFENTLGQPVDYYVKANFTGLKQVVDAVGGIDVTNTDTLIDKDYPCDDNQYKKCGYKLLPGTYHMNGAAALKYARCRKGTCGDDPGRAARQQQVMTAIRLKATTAGTLANPVKLAKLVSAAGSNIDTDLSVTNMLRLNQLTKQVSKDNTYDVVLGYTKSDDFMELDPIGGSDIIPKAGDGDFSDVKAFVADVFKLGGIWNEDPAITIENGTTTAGIGAKLKSTIDESGQYIAVDDVINAATSDHATSQIIDYSGGKMPHTINYLKSALGVSQVTVTSATSGAGPSDIVVILGADYAAKHAPTTSTTGTTSAQ